MPIQEAGTNTDLRVLVQDFVFYASGVEGSESFDDQVKKVSEFIQKLGNHNSTLETNELLPLLKAWKESSSAEVQRPNDYEQKGKTLAEPLASWFDKNWGEFCGTVVLEPFKPSETEAQRYRLGSGLHEGCSSSDQDIGVSCPIPTPVDKNLLAQKNKFAKSVDHVISVLSGAEVLEKKNKPFQEKLKKELKKCGYYDYRDKVFSATFAIPSQTMDEYFKTHSAAIQKGEIGDEQREKEIDELIEKRISEASAAIPKPKGCPADERIRQLDVQSQSADRLKNDFISSLDPVHPTFDQFLKLLEGLKSVDSHISGDVKFVTSILNDPVKRKDVVNELYLSELIDGSPPFRAIRK